MLKKELDELQEIARKATYEALKEYEPISEEWEKNLTLGVFFDGDGRVFELYVAAERPRDAIVISSVRINRKSKAVIDLTISHLKKTTNSSPFPDN